MQNRLGAEELSGSGLETGALAAKSVDEPSEALAKCDSGFTFFPFRAEGGLSLGRTVPPDGKPNAVRSNATLGAMVGLLLAVVVATEGASEDDPWKVSAGR